MKTVSKVAKIMTKAGDYLLLIIVALKRKKGTLYSSLDCRRVLFIFMDPEGEFSSFLAKMLRAH